MEALLVGIALLVGWFALFYLPPRVLRYIRSRPCPRCGERVEVGVMECPFCEFDFESIGTRS